MLIGGQSVAIGALVRVKDSASRAAFRGREGRIQGFRVPGNDGDVMRWGISKELNDVAVEFGWCIWGFSADDVEVLPKPEPKPVSDEIKLCGRINLYPSEFVGMTVDEAFECSENNDNFRSYARLFLRNGPLVLKDGVLAWAEKEEFRFSTTEDF
jgi:hypothetical protein